MRVFFLFFLLFLASCELDQGSSFVDYFIGTEGVELSFVDNAPPEEVFEGSDFSVHVLAHNLGSRDIRGSTFGLFRVTFDPFYFEVGGAENTKVLSVLEQKYFLERLVTSKLIDESSSSIPSLERSIRSLQAEVEEIRSSGSSDVVSLGPGDEAEIYSLELEIARLQKILSEKRISLDSARRLFAEGENLASTEGFSLPDLEELAVWFFDQGVLFPESSTAVGIAPFELIGKSSFSPAGEKDSFPLLTLKSRKLLGQREHPSSQVSVTACYPYSTNLSTSVCVDTDPYNINRRAQVCEASVIDSSAGQGAPITITSIESEMQPVDSRFVKPQFRITFENTGSGSVLSPLKPWYELCSFSGFDRDSFDVILVNASLLNTPLNCTPHFVTLRDGVGSTRCFVADSVLSGEEVFVDGREGTVRPKFSIDSPNFVSVLTVRADYVYFSTITKDVTVLRAR